MHASAQGLGDEGSAGQEVPCTPSWARPLCSQRSPGRGAAVASCVPTDDVLLLLCASQQWQVFLAERTEEWQHVAGIITLMTWSRCRGSPTPCPTSSTAGGRRRGRTAPGADRRAWAQAGPSQDARCQGCLCGRDEGRMLTPQQRGRPGVPLVLGCGRGGGDQGPE